PQRGCLLLCEAAKLGCFLLRLLPRVLSLAGKLQHAFGLQTDLHEGLGGLAGGSQNRAVVRCDRTQEGPHLVGLVAAQRDDEALVLDLVRCERHSVSRLLPNSVSPCSQGASSPNHVSCNGSVPGG